MNLKRLTLTFTCIACLLCIAPTVMRGSDISLTIKQEAEKCAQAIKLEDYATVVKYTHKRVVDGMGGKEKMIAIMKQGRAQMRQGGYDFVDAKIGMASEPRKIGKWLTSYVPQEIVMKVPNGRLHTESELLAISEDEGTTWVFIDLGPITPALFAQLFPELNGQITLPEKKKPIFHADSAASRESRKGAG